MTTTWRDEIAALGPCDAAATWLETQPTLETAWATCQRGDWMLWYLGKCDVDRRRLVLAACACARLALPYVPAGEQRPLRAIETAEQWARGENGVTLEQVRSDADAAAYAAHAAAAHAHAAYAAHAAAYAAHADAAAADAAYAHAAAAHADAAAAHAHQHVQQQCAALVRQHFPQVALPSTRPQR